MDKKIFNFVAMFFCVFLMVLITLLVYLKIIYAQTRFCLEECGGSWCEGDIRKYRIGVLGCCEYNQTSGECIKWSYTQCNINSENCNQYDRYVCGCLGNRFDKYSCFENWYCSDGMCKYRYENVVFCGNSEETDGGNNPDVSGTAIDRFCDKGMCKAMTLKDYCDGICLRSELIEYYIENDRVKFERYVNLFNENKYCKNGIILEDKNKPLVYLRLMSSDWTNIDILETLICNDWDESGCQKYNYRIESVIV